MSTRPALAVAALLTALAAAVPFVAQATDTAHGGGQVVARSTVKWPGTAPRA